MRYFSAMPGGLDGDLEAVARAAGGDDRHRRLAVAAVHRHEEVGRLGLGGQAGGRPAALDVDDQQRQLEADGEAHRLALEGDAGTAGGGARQVPAEGGAQGGADAGDLVFGLEGADAEVLVLRQLVEDVGRRRDRVAAEEQRQLRLLRRGDEPPRQRGVAGDVGVGAGLLVGRPHLVRVVEELGGLAEGVAGLEGGEVGVPHQRLGPEPAPRSTRWSARAGRVYIHETRPRAKKFFDRSASRGFTPERAARRPW